LQNQLSLTISVFNDGCVVFYSIDPWIKNVIKNKVFLILRYRFVASLSQSKFSNLKRLRAKKRKLATIKYQGAYQHGVQEAIDDAEIVHNTYM